MRKKGVRPCHAETEQDRPGSAPELDAGSGRAAPGGDRARRRARGPAAQRPAKDGARAAKDVGLDPVAVAAAAAGPDAARAADAGATPERETAPPTDNRRAQSCHAEMELDQWEWDR